MRFITGKAMLPEAAEARFQWVLGQNEAQHQSGFFGAWEEETGRFAGMGKLDLQSPGVAELGYALARQAWGKGFATEIAFALVQHAQSLPALSTLRAIASPDHHRSHHVLVKAGFSFFQSLEDEKGPIVEYRRSSTPGY